MEVLAQARIVMWEGAGLWVVDATAADVRDTKRTDFHAHHAIQVTIGLGGQFMLGTADESLRADAVAVAADVQHRVRGRGSRRLRVHRT